MSGGRLRTALLLGLAAILLASGLGLLYVSIEGGREAPQAITTTITAIIPTAKPIGPPPPPATTATTATTPTATTTTAPRIRAYEVSVEIRPGRGAALSYGVGAGDRVRIQLRGYHYSIRDRPERIFVKVHYEDGPLIAELAGYEIDYEFVAEGGTLGIFIGNPYAWGHIPDKYVSGSVTITSP
ncbi:MAG: hypothetical protein QW645_03310 [Candidatus Bathyarchaeia archaeon]